MATHNRGPCECCGMCDCPRPGLPSTLTVTIHKDNGVDPPEDFVVVVNLINPPDPGSPYLFYAGDCTEEGWNAEIYCDGDVWRVDAIVCDPMTGDPIDAVPILLIDFDCPPLGEGLSENPDYTVTVEE